jgi:hypothetical protein
MSSVVRLNVGGIKYYTTKSTLSKYPDNMLNRLVCGDLPTAKCDDGCIFIDRDGKLFEFVLGFLREDVLHLPEIFDDYHRLKMEAGFYCLFEMVEHIDSILVMPVEAKIKAKPTCYITIASDLISARLITITGHRVLLSYLAVCCDYASDCDLIKASNDSEHLYDTISCYFIDTDNDIYVNCKIFLNFFLILHRITFFF